jgi:hypothetical protein
MKRAEFVALEKKLLPALPGFTIKGPLVFVSPARSILRGINFEGSSFGKESFSVSFFVMPLCVPTEHLYFNFGNRLRNERGGDRWNKEMPNLVEELCTALTAQAVPFLSRAKTLVDFAEMAGSFPLGNPHTPMAKAFALARDGHGNKAIHILDQLLTQIDSNVAWQRTIADLSKQLRSMLIADPDAAQQQLQTWETETVRNLGLEKFQ